MQDLIKGAYPRWNISFNITMLRLLSFNMDYYWACTSAKTALSGDVRYFLQVSILYD